MQLSRLLIIVGSIVGIPSFAQGQLLADSIAEFSGSQGNLGWNYGYYDKTGDIVVPGYAVSDFQLMTQFDGTTWWVNNVNSTVNGYFTRLYATGGHSNGLDDYPGRLRAKREHFAVRRWTSDHAGLVQIDIKHFKIDPTPTATNFILYKNAVAIFNPNFGNTSTIPTTYTINATVAVGDKLDLFLDSWMAQDANDNSHLSMKITAVPEPSTIAACGLGVVLFLRRRRKFV